MQPQYNPMQEQQMYQGQQTPGYADPQGYQNNPAMMPYYSGGEMNVSNVLDQINPQMIIDNLDHSLKGEIFNKESGMWVINPSGKPLVNNNCRGAVISYITGLLTNNTTMAIIQPKELSGIMDSVIETITRTFVVNLEEFGFVPPGPGYDVGQYCNQGTPDTARMTQVANMVYSIVFLTLSRALKGMESKKVFSSLSMTDNLNYSPPPQQGNWMSKMFGR